MNEIKSFLVLPPLLEQWTKNEAVRLLEVEPMPIAKDLKHPKYCPHHWKRRHFFEQCYISKNFNNKHKARENFPQDGDTSINRLPFLKHDDRGNRQGDDGSQCKAVAEGNQEKAPEAELGFNRMARQVQNLFKLRNL